MNAKIDMEQYLFEKVSQHTESCMLGVYVKNFSAEDVYHDLVEGVSYLLSQDLLNEEITLMQYMEARNYAVHVLWQLMPEEEQ